MRLSALLALLLAAAGSQDHAAEKRKLDAETDALFAEVVPELSRYAGPKVALYGARRIDATPSGPMVDREAALFERRAAAGVVTFAGERDRKLAFNLLLHRPEAGQRAFDVVAASPDVGELQLMQLLLPELIVAGEWGEQRALRGRAETDAAKRRCWSRYLGLFALHAASRAPIEEWIAAEGDDAIAGDLLHALANLGDRAAIPFVRATLAGAKGDERRCAALFALGELGGRDLLPELRAMELQGAATLREREELLRYLEKETTPANPHGFDTHDSQEFIDRFADLHDAPVIEWLREHGRLDDEDEFVADRPLDAKEKASLFDALDDGLCFGLTAVRGSLYRSVTRDDLPRLLELRALAAWSPNEFTQANLKAFSILVRSVRYRD